VRIDHFGWLAPWYERFIRQPNVNVLRRLVEAAPEHNLLDVGGGTGRVAQHFVDMVEAAWILDLSHGMLLEAVKKANLKVCQGLSERLPFPDSTFARIITVDSFHHFQNHSRAAEELLRVLSPGGRLVLGEPDIRRLPVKLVALGEKLALMGSHFYAIERIADFFSGSNCTVSSYKSEGMNVWMVVDKR
jgi:demethylmenaquinone methyltransferase/2-methoxy-6-polyprenyl-1,4-benzoquinol methylase